MPNDILVAIRCTVYNHEPYLRDCLNGFVMQKTNFRYVAIVHDDCSTDGSAAIIREYAEKYPDIIKPIYETENQYSKGDGSLTRIMNEACKGAKYLASCKGDDYWTDPYKLQKQVDFLEAHSDFCDVIHGADADNMMTKADIITLCYQELGVGKSEVLYVGDTEYDAKGVAIAGVKFCAATWGYGFKKEKVVSDFFIDLVCHQPNEIDEV